MNNYVRATNFFLLTVNFRGCFVSFHHGFLTVLVILGQSVLSCMGEGQDGGITYPSWKP